MILRPHTEKTFHWLEALGLSVLVHAGAVVIAFDLWPTGTPEDTLPLRFPEIAVSNITVDEGTLAALAPEDTPDGAEAAEPIETPEDTPTAAEPDVPAPVEEPDVSAPGPIEPDLTPEPVAPLSPTDVTRLNPIRPEDGGALAGIAVPVTPLEPGGADSAIPQRITPVDPLTAGQGAVTRLPPVGQPAGPQQIAAPPPPQTPEETALTELVGLIRDRLGDPCLVALPQRQGSSAPLVVLVSDREATIADFSTAVLDNADATVDSQSVLVDQRQCPAVNYARANPDYPAYPLGLRLRSAEVVSGGRLAGTIDNIAGRYTSLLLVDDNGVVQDLRRFTRFVSGRAEFDVPVTRAGPARDTSQILFALATPGRPDTVTNLAGQLAQDFFPALQSELGNGVAVALVPFDVR